MTSTTRQSHKNNQKQPQAVDLSVCALCFCSDDDVENYGKFFRCTVQELAVHEYCLFFASGLAQNGKDDEGFDGFLYQDIRDEIKRASKLRCTVCHKKGASIGCCVYKCGSAFHFICGLQKHALFQFFDSFRTYCRRHRPTQNTVISFSESTQSPTCPICLCDVENTDTLSSLKSPCCKNAWFHRSCIQKQALANGMYYFRCAFCNNTDEFQEEMKQMGIYIPVRDAIWEQGDAYVELLHQHNRCDAPNCACPKGRDFSGTHKGQKWKIYKCFACGQSGTHKWCQNPAITRKYLCQNCEVCFPQHEQAKSNTSALSGSENGSFNDSQSAMLLDTSQESEVTQDMNASIDDIPLVQLKAKIAAGSKESAFSNAASENKPSTSSLTFYSEPDQELDDSSRNDVPLSPRLRAKKNTGLNKDDHDSNADSETTTLSMESGLACVNKDGICTFDHYTTIVSTDDSDSIDIENLSTVSSCASNVANDIPSLNINNPKVKLKGKKRCKQMQGNAVTQTTKSKPRTKAIRKLDKKEKPKQKKKMQQGERRKLKKKTRKNEAGMSNKSDTKKNDSCNDQNDSFCLNLSLESDLQGNGLKTKSPNQIGNIPEDSIEEDCSDKFVYDESFPVASGNEMVNATSREDDEITKGKTGSSLKAEQFGIETTSPSTMQLSLSKSNGSEISISNGKKKLLQRDIRSMLISCKSDPDSPLKSPTGFEDNGYQTQPLKLHGAKKRRKISPSIPECKSITTFMSVNASSPKRKLPKKKLHCATLNSLPSNNDTETASSPVSHLFTDTMTAAKGMVMHAFNRLCGSSEESDSSTCTPKKSSESDESLKSGPSEVKEHVNSTSAHCSTRESMCLEDSNSDSSDSIKVVKVKKGRGRRNINSGVPVKTGVVPGYIHEKYCACYKMRQWMPKELSKPTDPKEVIVIDDENDEPDEQDSGKGSSRGTSDVGTKSGDGNSSADDKEIPCNEDGNQMDSFCYSSCDDVSFDDHEDSDRSNTSQSRNTDAASSLQTVDSRKQKRSKRDCSKSSKRDKTRVKKRTKYSENLCHLSHSDVDVETPPVSSNSSSLTEKHFMKHGDGVDDSIECTENNYFKKEFKRKTSQENGTQSPLSKKGKSKEFGNERFLSLKKYMECSDEDFQAKKSLTSKTKGVKSAKSSNKDKDKTKKRKTKKSSTKEHFGNSSCTSTVSANVAGNTL